MEDSALPMATLVNHSLDNMLRKINSDVSKLRILIEKATRRIDVGGHIVGSIGTKACSRVRHPDLPTDDVASSSEKLERCLNGIEDTVAAYSQRSSSSTDLKDEKDMALQKLFGLIQPWRLQWQDIEICKIRSGDFTLPKEIGRGTCSMIYLAKLRKPSRESGEEEFVEVAAKSMEGRPTSREVCESFLTESSILHSARHPCIVGFFGAYWPHTAAAEKNYDGGWPKPLIVVELMSGNLAELLSSVKKAQIVQVLRDVGEALVHLHQGGIVHMDVKPENVLINVDSSGAFIGRAKVTDFGVSRRKGESRLELGNVRSTVVGGTLEFLAPEVLGEGGKAATCCDVWSFGAFMCWLLCAHDSGGHGKSQLRLCDMDVIAAVRNGTLRENWLRRLSGSNADENLRDLAADCLSLLPEDRPCMQDVCLALEYYEAGLDRTWIKKIRGKSKDVVLESGIRRYFGVDCDRDKAEAGKWFQFADDLGCVEAEYMLNVAFVTENGIARPREDIHVIHDIHRQIELDRLGDNGSGEYLLAMFYRHGVTVKEDGEQAVKFLRESMEVGNICAQSELGDCYLIGQCVPKDTGRAMELLQKAADCGNATAQFRLGVCFDSGLDMRKNWREATKYLEKAANAGHTEAKEYLHSMRGDD